MATTSLSPQARAIVEKLLAGQPVGASQNPLGPLTKSAQTLLDVFTKNLAELERLKGDDRARRIRDLFSKSLTRASDAAASIAASTKAPLMSFPAPPRWRMLHLRCCSIRGIAPPGEEFDFEFHGRSHLIYGPNGSGKSSLLGALVWLFTGAPLTDTVNQVDQAAIYEVGEEAKAGKKIREWPVVATLPSANVTKATPNSWAVVLLERPTDGVRLHVRRRFGSSLEASLNSVDWTRIEDLNQIGIEPLDVQLSLIAPTVFGRRCIEEADDARSILSLMLGLDDLESLGELASQIGMNRTRLANVERHDIAALLQALTDKLRLLSSQLPDGSEAAKEVSNLANLATQQKLTTPAIEDTKRRLDSLAAAAEAQLAQALGLALSEGQPSAGLADRLVIAADAVAKGVDALFPKLAAIRLTNALPPNQEKDSARQLEDLEASFAAFLGDTKRKVSQRHDWWKQELAPGSKCSLLLKAAQHYTADTGECPVCDRVIENEELRQRLVALKAMDSNLGIELRTFFADQKSELESKVPKAIAGLAAESPVDRVTTDWTSICNDLLGDSFSTLAAKHDAAIAAQRAELAISPIACESILPADCEVAFVTAARTYCVAVEQSHSALRLLRWSSTSLDSILQALDQKVAAPLSSELEKGKTAAAVVKPLSNASEVLASVATAHSAIDRKRDQLATLESLEDPLNELKALSKYAEKAVRSEFDGIKAATTANLKSLYPENSTGMQPGTLKLGTGKDKSIEALLKAGTFEVPGQHFANAGLQRAIALSFYFALLDRHRDGLGFIVMDDPILSLDEDHRERWSGRILRPKLSTVQTILATHQREFLRNCARDFDADRVVELNPRHRNCRISWRPGDRLKRAEAQLNDGDYIVAAKTMRDFGEDVLISLDAYSSAGFFDQDNLSASRDRYEKLKPPDPLAAGTAQNKICQCLRLSEVERVLNPSSHSMTQADVTAPMAADCLEELKKINSIVAKELVRLERERTRQLRGSAIEATFNPFPTLMPAVCWANEIALPLVGAVAAKSNSLSVEFSQEGGSIQFAPGAAVQVVGEGMDPVASHGHWVLLAEEGQPIHDGDLVAARDGNGGAYLRRVWSEGRDWVLQSVNPVRPIPSITVSKRTTGLRQIVGVLYRPLGSAKVKTGQFAEWSPCTGMNAAQVLTACRAISIVGDSLAPLARNGQKVLVDEPLTDHAQCTDGDLAIIEFKERDRGAVVKQLFRNGDAWVLTSPNPIDRIAPMLVPATSIRAIWMLRGILFESVNLCSVESA